MCLFLSLLIRCFLLYLFLFAHLSISLSLPPFIRSRSYSNKHPHTNIQTWTAVNLSFAPSSPFSTHHPPLSPSPYGFVRYLVVQIMIHNLHLVGHSKKTSVYTASPPLPSPTGPIHRDPSEVQIVRNHRQHDHHQHVHRHHLAIASQQHHLPSSRQRAAVASSSRLSSPYTTSSTRRTPVGTPQKSNFRSTHASSSAHTATTPKFVTSTPSTAPTVASPRSSSRVV